MLWPRQLHVREVASILQAHRSGRWLGVASEPALWPSAHSVLPGHQNISHLRSRTMSYCIEVPMGMITVCFHRLVVESRGRCSETLDTNMPFMCDSHSTDRWRLGVIGQFASKRKSFSVLVCKESENSRKWREHQRERNLVWWPVKIESPPSSGAGRPG